MMGKIPTFNPIYLKTENHLNKILKRQKKTKEEIYILFISMWDKHSQALVENVKRYREVDGAPLYIVDSFRMPHAFVIFNSTKLPHLVKLGNGISLSEDYLPVVYHELGL